MYRYGRDSYAFHKMNDDVAYWLGFLYTDGSISSKGSIQLKLKDRQAIEAFRQFVKYQGKISTVVQNKYGKTYTHYQVRISDQIMASQLIKLGCIPNKTYKLKFPTKEQLDQKYYPSFIRGVFDGDGSVFRSCYTTKIQITGTQKFLQGIKNCLISNQIIPDSKEWIYKAHSNNPIIKRLSIGSKQVSKLFYDFIYKDIYGKPYLKRKKQRFQRLLEGKEENDK